MRGALRFALLGALLGAAGCPGRTALDDRDGIDAGTGSGTDGGVAPTSCEATFTLSGFAGAGQVWLTGSFTDWAESPAAGAVVLERVGDVFTTTLTLDPGRYLYKFVVDGANWIADPSNPIGEPDGFGGQNSVYSCALALCGDADAFDWRDAVMYFAMVDRFYDSDGQAQPVPGATDGDATVGSSGQYEGGDLRGVAQKVPYLADLGVTALWLSAPYENRNETGIGLSDGYQYSGYHGYWPSPANIDYSNFANPSPRPRVESRIGSEADLRALIDSAHGASSANGDGIKMLFDYVMNHVDGNSGLFAAHPDWVAYDNGNIRLCGSDCGGGQCWDDSYWGTRCAFTDYLPPLDYGNLEARAWSIDDAMWWAQEYGIDGYRLDAIKHVPLEWLTELRARLNADVSDPPGGRFYLVGETFDYFNRDLLKRFVDPDTMLDGQFDFPFKREVCEGVFNPFGDLRALASFMDGNDRFYDSATRRAIMSTWIGNHDVPRPIHFADWRFGNCTEGSHGGNSWAAGQFPQPSGPEPYERLAVSFAVMMTNPGVPLIYYGDEIGLAGGGDPDNRRMMPWNDNALNPHQRALRDKVRALARLRGRLKALGRGSRVTHYADQDSWVYRMGGCGDGAGIADVIVVINAADSARTVPVPPGAYLDEIGGGDVSGGDVSLAARSFLILTPR